MSIEGLEITGKNLGKGGFGTVFMGQLDGMKVAAKRLSQSEREIDSLVREASRLKKLRYGKHIAYIYGIMSKNENLYMVMEYGRFGDLKSFLNRNAGLIAYERKILFCRGILLGVLYCHSMKVFHGDIKCSNVILGKNLEPKLTDFGLSMTVDNIEYYGKLYDGSLYWAAPELFSIRDEVVYQEFIADPYPCDVYSLGATFCEISYDGATKFIDSNDPGMEIMLGFAYPIPKNAFLQGIVNECCQFERNERISLDECLSALDNVAEEQLPIHAINDEWLRIQQDIQANSNLELPPSFILHRPIENSVVSPSNLSLLEWLCINNCINAVKYMIQLHEHNQDQDQIKWLYEISELCKSSEVAGFLQILMQNSEPSRLTLSSLIDSHTQQFVEMLIKAGASSCSYILLKKAIEKCHNMTVQAIIDRRNHLKDWAAYDAVKFGNAEAVRILANAGSDLEWSDCNTGYTPLKIAIDTENIEIVKILLELGVNVNNANYYIQDDMGAETQRRPLYLATLKGNREIAKLLVDAGATVDITSSEWCSLSQNLEQQGNPSMMRFISNIISKRSSPVENNSLCAAIRNKQPDYVQAFIDNKTNVDEVGLDGYAPLHWAVVVGDEEIVSILIKAGADLDIRTSSKKPNLQPGSSSDYFSECTPLHIAVAKGYLSIAKLLIESGADFSAKNGLQQIITNATKESKKEIEKIIMECAPVNVISIRRAIKSMSHESIKIMISDQQINAKVLSECLCIAASNSKNDLVKYLLQCGVNINKEHQRKTPLWWAIFWGNIEAAKILISAGANISIKNTHQKTPLFQCVYESQLDMVQFLVDQGADVNAKDEYEKALIYYANNKDVLEILINAGADISAKGQYGATCLIQHVDESDTEMVQFLLDKGADVNVRDIYGNAPIHYANSKSVLEILINAGADINAKGQYGATCIIQQVKKSDAGVVQFLVDNGADVNVRDKDGNAPIHYANNKSVLEILINAGAYFNIKSQYGTIRLIQYIRKSDTEMVQFLVDKGANINVRDKDGNAPIHYVNKKDVLEILINAGADINAKDQYGTMCLIQHIKELNTEMVQFLADNGADVNARDNYGNAPIYYAKNKEIMKILVNAGADINAKGQYGIAHLIQHVKKSDTEMVQFLVNKGADVNARDIYGNAPIYYANNKEIMRILINTGADFNVKSQRGTTCLIQYVKKSDTEMVQFLLNKGVSGNARDEDGNAPIHYTNNKYILEILINFGADINVKDCFGITYLIQYVKKSDTEMVQFLLSKGADINARDKYGDAPIHFVRDKEIAKTLINAGADISAKNKHRKVLFDILIEE